MKWKTLAGLLVTAAALEMSPRPAAACGIKLTIKTGSPHRMARVSNPSHVLLIGSHNHKLESELAREGHDVEVESSPADAKRTSYAAVVVDPGDEAAARQQFGSDVVIVSSGDESTDMVAVNDKVARKPIAVDQPTLINAEARRQPIAAGPKQHVRIAAKTEDETPPAAEPKPEPKPVEVQPAPTPPVAEEPKPAPSPAIRHEEPKPAETASEEPKPAPVKPAKSGHMPNSEVYFVLGGAKLTGSAQHQLNRVAKWLNDHGDVQVTIEGYADPTGTHDGNMALSQSRAEAARDYLASQGVDSSRMDVQAFGDTKLKYGASDGRNRRIIVVPKQP